MARMPGAVWKPMVASSTTPMSRYDVLCFHTCVGSLAGTDSWFRSQANGLNSHFGVGGDGTIWQWVDTAYRSGASYNGNYHLISVECADMGAPFGPWAGSDVPAWTDAQIAALGRIAAWANATHGVPLTQIPDAKASRRGIGYHRLGVPGYMVAGAEQWSTKAGKVCPGDRRIAQIPQVIAAANGANPGSSIVLDTETATQISKIVVNALTTPGVGALDWKGTKNGPQSVVGQMRLDAEGLGAIYTMVAGQNAAIEKLAEAIASGRDDLTADELRQAVSGAIQDAGAALRATQATAGPAQ